MSQASSSSMSSQGSAVSRAVNSKQSVKWVFTINNYTDEDKEHLAELSWSVKYLVYGHEVAPTTGTPHLQGFILFNSNQREKAVCKKLGGACYVHVADGTAWEGARYCWKDDNDYVEYGVRPVESYSKKGGERTKQNWEDALAAAKVGDFDRIPADMRIRFYSTFGKIAKDHMTPPEPQVASCGLWIYGGTGTGKSHAVVTQHPGR